MRTASFADPRVSLRLLAKEAAALVDAGHTWAPDDLEPDTSEFRDAVTLLAAVDDLISAARSLRSQVAEPIGDAIKGAGTVEVPGVGSVERKSGAQRKQWDHPRLAPLVAIRAIADRDTGEVRQDIASDEAAQLGAEAVLAAAGISYWRVGALRKLGIEADGYCHVEYGGPSVVLRRADGRAS